MLRKRGSSGPWGVFEILESKKPTGEQSKLILVSQRRRDSPESEHSPELIMAETRDEHGCLIRTAMWQRVYGTWAQTPVHCRARLGSYVVDLRSANYPPTDERIDREIDLANLGLRPADSDLLLIAGLDGGSSVQDGPVDPATLIPQWATLLIVVAVILVAAIRWARNRPVVGASVVLVIPLVYDDLDLSSMLKPMVGVLGLQVDQSHCSGESEVYGSGHWMEYHFSYPGFEDIEAVAPPLDGLGAIVFLPLDHFAPHRSASVSCGQCPLAIDDAQIADTNAGWAKLGIRQERWMTRQPALVFRSAPGIGDLEGVVDILSSTEIPSESTVDSDAIVVRGGCSVRYELSAFVNEGGVYHASLNGSRDRHTPGGVGDYTVFVDFPDGYSLTIPLVLEPEDQTVVVRGIEPPKGTERAWDIVGSGLHGFEILDSPVCFEFELSATRSWGARLTGRDTFEAARRHQCKPLIISVRDGAEPIPYIAAVMPEHEYWWCTDSGRTILGGVFFPGEEVVVLRSERGEWRMSFPSRMPNMNWILLERGFKEVSRYRIASPPNTTHTVIDGGGDGPILVGRIDADIVHLMQRWWAVVGE